MMEGIRSAMEWAAFVVDTFAVAVILIGIVIATIRCRLVLTLISPNASGVESLFKKHAVGCLLIGLDLLVASDVIASVALERTINSVATLGLLVVIRIALTWSLIVEAEGRWPWQPRAAVGESGAQSE